MDKVLKELMSIISQLGTTLCAIFEKENLSKEGKFFIGKTIELANKQLDIVTEGLQDIRLQQEKDYSKLN